jgi:hypothetical protein
MPSVPILTFEGALRRSLKGKRHLLLGNGFSIALRSDIFTYGALFDHADFSSAIFSREIFELLETRDFETVIKLLVDMSQIISLYAPDNGELVNAISRDADALKTVLVNVIASRHPDRPYDVAEEQYIACRQFLSNFSGSHIYTLNYDVLLYWVLMHTDVDRLDLRPDDGFREDEDNEEAPYVTWQEGHRSSIHYLHGALHLFDAGHQLQKYTWSRTDIAIVDQVRDALDNDRYPLFVAEGTSDDKLTKIMHSAYLHKALRSFEAITGNLFIFGHSLADNDDHIFKALIGGKVKSLFVSLYGDPENPENQGIINRAKFFSRQRKLKFGDKYPLEINFFDAETAQVWG